eukprot:UN14128
MACCGCPSGGYINLISDQTFTSDTSVALTPNVASDITLDLDSEWSISGWITGTSAEFDLTMRCDSSNAICYGIGIRDGYLKWIATSRRRRLNGNYSI